MHYWKLAFRVLLRRKFFTAVSLLGIGFTLTVILIVAALLDGTLVAGAPETNLNRCLFVSDVRMTGETSQWSSAAGYKLLDHYLRDVPGVAELSIVGNRRPLVLFRNDEKLTFQLRRTDGAYWRLHEFRFLEGRPFTDDDDRAGRSVAVISESTRRRLFGEDDAVGKTIESMQLRLEVVGVVADVPITREMTYSDLYVPIQSDPSPVFRETLLGDFHGVFLLAPGTDARAVQREIEARMTRVELTHPEVYDRIEARPRSRAEHMAANALMDTYASESKTGLFFLVLGAFAVLLLLLPSINLMNMNVSRILERSSEIGVRKAFGATQASLIFQFVFENIVLALIGALLGFLGAYLLLGGMEATGTLPTLPTTPNPRVFLYALLAAVAFGALSGAYPAWRMSRLSPVAALKGVIR